MSRIKSMIYKKEYDENESVPELDINQIAEPLIKVKMIPHFLDYELVNHEANFRNIKEGTREDIIFHYVDYLPIFQEPKKGEDIAQILEYKYRDTITKVDIVSFFTNPKDGIFEHRIYQIGARYGSGEYTINNLFGLGELNYDIKNYDKAIEFYTVALEYEPDDADILTNLGLAYVCKDEYQKTIQLYKRALEIDPEDPLIWDNLGISYENIQDYEKAKETYRKASDLDPDDPEILNHLKKLEDKE